MARRTASHVDNAAQVGARLREARTERGLRLRDLAFPGCSVGYLSHIERGARIPSLQVLRALADRLDLSEQWLATGTYDERSDRDVLAAAEAALRFDDLETAERLYRTTADRATDDRTLARARAGLGQLAFRLDDAETAMAELEAARALDATLLDDDGFVDTLGRVHAHLGDVEGAVALFRRRVAAAGETGNTVSRVRFSVLLANGLIDLSAFSEAAHVLSDVLAETTSDDPVLLARLYWSQSRLHTMKDETALAARFANKALELLEATEFTQYRSRAHHLLAYIEIDRGEHEHALELIEAGRELARAGGTAFDTARFDLEEARARAALGELDTAATLTSRAAKELAHHHPVDLGRCYAELASITAESGALERARELYELAIEFLEHAPNRWLVSTYARYGELLEQSGDIEGAFAAYKRAAVGASSLEAGADRAPH
jgi:transcriptional regulator with XRE-family HTH domain